MRGTDTSVPLRKDNRHLTTFITPLGRYRYCCNPQGFMGAGDGYICCFNAVHPDFTRKERCVNTVFWARALTMELNLVTPPSRAKP